MLRMKIAGLEGYDLKVIDRIPIEMPARKENEQYLKTKFEKLGHFLHL